MKRFTPVQYATDSIEYRLTICPTIGGPTKANTELKAHIIPVQAPRESASSLGRIKATPDAGSPNREPPRIPNRMQKARAWLSCCARGHRGSTTITAPKQLTACTMAGFDHLRFCQDLFSYGWIGSYVPCTCDGCAAQAANCAAPIRALGNGRKICGATVLDKFHDVPIHNGQEPHNLDIPEDVPFSPLVDMEQEWIKCQEYKTYAYRVDQKMGVLERPNVDPRGFFEYRI